MPFPQTTIADDPARAYPGQIADCGFTDSLSRSAEGPVTEGQPVLRGTDPDHQAAQVANGDTLDASTFLGFASLDSTRPFIEANAGAIPDGRMFGVLHEGRMYVRLTGAATAGQQVFVGNATAQLGDIQGTTGTGLVAAPGCRFMESGSADDLVQIEILKVA